MQHAKHVQLEQPMCVVVLVGALETFSANQLLLLCAYSLLKPHVREELYVHNHATMTHRCSDL